MIYIWFQYIALNLPSIRTGTKLIFTYEVEWEASEIRWASRWDTYLAMSDVQIHWFSIINSLVIVFFLAGSYANSYLSVPSSHWTRIILFLIRYSDDDHRPHAQKGHCEIQQRRRDGRIVLPIFHFASFRGCLLSWSFIMIKDETLEESGWKLVHGDVFRAPRYPKLFSALIGSGIQIFFVSLITICKLPFWLFRWIESMMSECDTDVGFVAHWKRVRNARTTRISTPHMQDLFLVWHIIHC